MTSEAETPSTRCQGCTINIAGAFSLRRWMHLSILWPLSSLNSQNLFLFQFSVEPDIGGGALNFIDDGLFFLDSFATTTSPLRKAVVTLIILSIDFGMLSSSHLIKSGLVMPCMNLDTLMHFRAPLTCMISSLKLST
ncbi:hypothetical protein Tco_1511211 [Tanacetum coccineum]